MWGEKKFSVGDFAKWFIIGLVVIYTILIISSAKTRDIEKTMLLYIEEVDEKLAIQDMVIDTQGKVIKAQDKTISILYSNDGILQDRIKAEFIVLQDRIITESAKVPNHRHSQGGICYVQEK